MNLQAIKEQFTCEICQRPLSRKAKNSNGVVCSNCLHIHWIDTESETGKTVAGVPEFLLSVLQTGSVIELNQASYTVCGYLSLEFNSTFLQIWNLISEQNKICWLTETPGIFKFYPEPQKIFNTDLLLLKNVREGKSFTLIHPELNGEYKLQSIKSVHRINFAGEFYIPPSWETHVKILDSRHENGNNMLAWLSPKIMPAAISGMPVSLTLDTIQNPALKFE